MLVPPADDQVTSEAALAPVDCVALCKAIAEEVDAWRTRRLELAVVAGDRGPRPVDTFSTASTNSTPAYMVAAVSSTLPLGNVIAPSKPVGGFPTCQTSRCAISPN
jgi:hypothetical protein